MLKISGSGIRLTRGDSARFTIRMTGREVPDGTKTLFTVKKKAYQHDEALIEECFPVVGNAVHVLLPPESTDFPAGNYVWDLRVLLDTEEGHDVLTPMEYSTFHVVEAIGYE